MAQGFSLNQSQAFQCQNCREFINTSMTNCSYCGVAINSEAAFAAADIQAAVAKACNDAKYMRLLARVMVGFFLAMWISSLSILVGMEIPVMLFVLSTTLARWGYWVLLVIVLVMLVRWWVKYHNLQSSDGDYEKAKHDTIITAAIWSALIFIWLTVSVTITIQQPIE